MSSSLDVQLARSHFPSLTSGYVFADSAGGSQALKSVADATYDYLLNTNAQLGASYPTSQRATARVGHGADAAAIIFNAESADEVAFGPSTTQLLANLARAIGPALKAGDEIVVTGEHESNVGPWRSLSVSRSPPLPLHTWAPSSTTSTNPYALTYASALPALLKLITPRTRVLALSGCSNILGEVVDLEGVVKAVRAQYKEVGGQGDVWIVVDLVAYAPHRSIDVRKWDIDFAVFSFYKVYGTHTAALYTRGSILPKLGSVTHHFHMPRYAASPFKLQTGGPGYELVFASAAVLPYLVSLSSPNAVLLDSEELLRKRSKQELRAALEQTSVLFHQHEKTLMEPVLNFLKSERAYARGVRIVGIEDAGHSAREPTMSFVVVGDKSMKSRDIVERIDTLGTIGIRYGHFYAFSIVSTLPGFTPSPTPGKDERSVEDGVVRISLVHYHTVEDAKNIVKALEGVLFE